AFNGGASLVDSFGNAAISNFSGGNAFSSLSIAPPAQTTMLASNVEVTVALTLKGGVVAELGSRNLTLHSPLASPLSIVNGTLMSFSTFTWITSTINPTIPSYIGYPALALQS